MIIRILLIIIIAGVLWAAIRLILLFYSLILNMQAIAKGQRPYSKQNLDHKTMVKCSKCELYVLDKEAIMYEGKPYCCQEHARDSQA